MGINLATSAVCVRMLNKVQGDSPTAAAARYHVHLVSIEKFNFH